MIRLPGGLLVTHQKLLWAVILFALVVGLSVAFMHCRDTGEDLQQSTQYDAADYHRLAVSLLSHHSYDSTYRAPAYPAFVALVYAVAGPRPGAVYIVQAIIFVATLLLVHRITRYIGEKDGVSLLTVALCAIWLPFYRSISAELTEILSGFLLAMSVWCILMVVARPTYLGSAAAGVLTAISALVKSVVLPFVAVAPLLVVFGGEGRWRRLIPAAVLIVGAAAVLVPWTVRNYRVTGEIVPVSTGGGVNFWLGNWPGFHSHVWDGKKFPPPLDRMLIGKSETERDRIFMKQGMEYIREDPLRAVGIFARKFGALWLGTLGINIDAVQGKIPHIGKFGIPKLAFIETPLFVLAIVGWVLLSGPAKRRAYPVLALLLIWTAAYVVLTADRRYVIPVEFYKIFLVSVAICRIWDRLGNRIFRRSEPHPGPC